jgi:hypothetical protein
MKVCPYTEMLDFSPLCMESTVRERRKPKGILNYHCAAQIYENLAAGHDGIPVVKSKEVQRVLLGGLVLGLSSSFEAIRHK